MSPRARSISKNLLILALPVVAAFLQGCATATTKIEHRLKLNEPVIRVFAAKYEEVEGALKSAMLKYPQRIDNTEAGIFETDYVKGDARFKPPHKDAQFSSGLQYRILIRLVKGRADNRSSAVQVVVRKQIELKKDFFQQPVPVQSDGLEENVILYRISRELVIARAIQRAAERGNKQGGGPPPEKI